MRRDKPARPWHLFLLAAVVIALAVLAATQIGPPGTSTRTSREVVTAERGVVQTTVTGTGNVEAGTDVDVNFQTSGTLSRVFVSQGQHVNEGQLLATLDSTSAQLSVDQAQEALTAAQDQLTEVENGTATGGSGSSGSGSGQTASLETSGASSTEFVSLGNATRKPATPKTKTTPTTAPTPTPTPTRTVTVQAPSTSAPSRTSSSGGSSTSTATKTSTTPTTTTTTPSPSSIASAQAAVYQAEANLHTAQQALTKTNLYAPVSGTIVSLAGLSPGDSVSAGSSGTASSSSSSGSGSGSGSGTSSASGGAGSATVGSLGGSSASSSSSSGSGSSTSFAQIVDTGSLTMPVAFSESDISKVHVGQSATVTMEALSGVELGAHVSAISSVGTSSSGVVSYDATLTLDQTDARVKPGMSASAAVITGQAQGVTVPNQAIIGTGSLGTVNVFQSGKTVQKQVIVGLRGTSRTQIVSGLTSGSQLVVTVTLPSLSTQSSSTTPTSGSGRFGGVGGFGGAGGFGGGGTGARSFFGGGGAGAAPGGGG
jgi:multidrug efflux pump subunit AcrA (membrane-fusion protein)